MAKDKPTDTFNWINIFDGGLGRDGQYTWRELPQAMTKADARTYCSTNDLCPPERFSVEAPRGYTSSRAATATP
mgnify:CR=1 FL=1